MRFVHACGDLDWLLKSNVLDHSRDFWGLIELGEVVLPRPMGL